uniref:Uncharacterized protein n=1 Tax=Triticum urartu TaxID=4572 RepID=A0A8R7PX73_TRIUA
MAHHRSRAPRQLPHLRGTPLPGEHALGRAELGQRRAAVPLAERGHHLHLPRGEQLEPPRQLAAAGVAPRVGERDGDEAEGDLQRLQRGLDQALVGPARAARGLPQPRQLRQPQVLLVRLGRRAVLHLQHDRRRRRAPLVVRPHGRERGQLGRRHFLSAPQLSG